MSKLFKWFWYDGWITIPGISHRRGGQLQIDVTGILIVTVIIICLVVIL